MPESKKRKTKKDKAQQAKRGRPASARRRAGPAAPTAPPDQDRAARDETHAQEGRATPTADVHEALAEE